MSENRFNDYINSIERLFQSGDSKAIEKLEEAANVRLLQNLIRAIGLDDLVTVSELLAENVRLEILGPAEIPFIRNAKGQEQMLEVIKQNFGAVQEQILNLNAVIAQGDTVVVMMDEEGKVQATGERYKIKGLQRFVMRDGKVELVEELFLRV
jgi:ketosteroid isomerase-like protein